ncbi:EF-hand domain-containing protein 1 isoform X1 [Plutella xylostella]|uniref:EF-hand domain-containing protein 1 isoform X1 n=1 Tax=Plutella xylostella TaxID=51655 RepID=UPI0020325AD4|nr:EF-hand domain-containing protein 1 isoform X1 [Plutella xylostella]
MAWGLPKLPGLSFSDPTKSRHHLRGSLRFHHGHRFPDTRVTAPGGEPTDVDSNAFALPDDSVNYDPSLTYGRVKQPALPQVIPRWVHYDQRCLNFTAFMKQPVFDSPDEAYRVRVVNIIYFLEDDTMTVMEPHVHNSGLWQGRMVKRDKIPKNDLGESWHWKDLDNGKDICIFGKVFHTVSCDLYTKEWLESQGIELSAEEELPEDPYTARERWRGVRPPARQRPREDRLRRFLEYDGKVLAFDCVWDNREFEECGEFTKYKLCYYLQDDTIAIKEIHDGRGGKDPFPLLLKKTKLPKKWKEKPVDFPSAVLEMSDAEVAEYYAPRDLLVGATVFVLARRFLLYDCDAFTRHYYKSMLGIDQPARVELQQEVKKEFKKELPPHIHIGTPEDTLQSCFGLVPKPPPKDVVKYTLNAAKNLRYLCELVWVHPEDEGRQFVLSYNLGDGQVKIGEIPRRNSGIQEGRFLSPCRLPLPDSDPNFPTYYTPDKFYIGAIVHVFKHRFIITGCDLFVHRYLSANPDKFPPEVIDNVRDYHMRAGNLKDELRDACIEEQQAAARAQLSGVGAAAVAASTNMERCLEALNVQDGSAAPPRPPTPPTTTDRISYEDSLRFARLSKPTCDNITPLKGILKSGVPREEHQKVVCFSGPTADEPPPPLPKHKYYPPGTQPHYNEEEDYCDRFKEPGVEESAARRAQNICAYDVIPSPETVRAVGEDVQEQKQLPGYLGSRGVDCKEIPEYMRLAPDAYNKVKSLRRDTPEVSPAATRVQHLPRAPFPDVGTCAKPPEDKGPCAEAREQDVAFACPRVEPRLPCCDPRDRNPREEC